MSDYNQPEEYYRQHKITRMKAGAGPHLGADADLSYDLVEKDTTTGSQPVSENGQLKCYQRTKRIRYLFTWRYHSDRRKFTLVSKEVVEIWYGPLVEVKCPPTLANKYRTPELKPVDEEKLDPCPEKDGYGTEGKEPDDFYRDYFTGMQLRLVQRQVTSRGQNDFIELDSFHYAKVKMDSGERCYRRARHIKAKLYWTLCRETGKWHLHLMDYYVNLWGPWIEIQCHQIPVDAGYVATSISD